MIVRDPQGAVWEHEVQEGLRNSSWGTGRRGQSKNKQNVKPKLVKKTICTMLRIDHKKLINGVYARRGV